MRGDEDHDLMIVDNWLLINKLKICHYNMQPFPFSLLLRKLLADLFAGCQQLSSALLHRRRRRLLLAYRLADALCCAR